MGLLIKLEEKLSEDDKVIPDKINATQDKPFSFTFGEIFSKAHERKVGIVQEKELVKKIELLIEKRNTYIHASNFLSGLIISLKKTMTSEIDDTLKNISMLENGRFRFLIPALPIMPKIKYFLKEQLSVIDGISDLA